MRRGADEATEAAALVLPCADLDAALHFFVDRLRFRLDAIFPADDPGFAEISGHGLRIELVRAADAAPAAQVRLRLPHPGAAPGARVLVSPDGTQIELIGAETPLALPTLAPSFALSRARDARWTVGRADMRYRDLVPDRQGGRFIASHIRLEAGGPVPDYVHYHRVRFQMIYCYRGWVRVVYEDQGPAFVMEPGDCVLQPPGIRHRVLEASPGLEVVEVGCPARHETRIEHELALPTPMHRPDRDFGGQRFVRHRAANAAWRPEDGDALEVRETGIAAASGGLASARVLRPRAGSATRASSHDAQLLFQFVLAGRATLFAGERAGVALGGADAFVIPAGMRYALADCSAQLELLEVRLPAICSATQAPRPARSRGASCGAGRGSR